MKKAFTLIELLIVIAIIGILTVVSLSSYSSTRQVAEINIQTDTLVTLLREAKGKAQNTTPDDEGKLYCIGYKFTQTTETSNIEKIKVPYKNQFDPCEINATDSEEQESAELNDIELEVTKINVEANSDTSNPSNLTFIHYPPKGEFKAYTDNNPEPILFDTITIETKLKDKINNNLIKISNSGLIQKERKSNETSNEL